MKYAIISLLILVAASLNISAQQFANKKYVLVIHGGAGNISKGKITADKEKQYLDGLRQALLEGHARIKDGKSSIDAVEAAIKVLEDNPLFNAGKGAVLNSEGKIELDASIMDGKTLKAGSVAGVTTIKNPVTGARAVMEKSAHVMLAGRGAESFAKDQGLEIVDPSYFHVNKASFQPVRDKFGTVGAVALDKNGNLAAGTSTGGMSGKKYGRIGDSPIIGAGTYADNNSAAVSCTGWGEFFIRYVAAYDVCATMKYRKMSLEKSAKSVIDKIARGGGDGGMIALDRKGNITASFSTAGMFRAAITEKGEVEVYMYK